MVVCMVGNQAKDVYDAIKRTCCLENSIPSQVFQAKHMAGKNAMSVTTKIAVQMLTKLGGEMWGVTFPVFFFFKISVKFRFKLRKK